MHAYDVIKYCTKMKSNNEKKQQIIKIDCNLVVNDNNINLNKSFLIDVDKMVEMNLLYGYGIIKIVSNFLFHVIVYMCKMNFDVFLLFVARQTEEKSFKTRKKTHLIDCHCSAEISSPFFYPLST